MPSFGLHQNVLLWLMQKLNLIENEVIILRNAFDHIGDLVNHSLIELHGKKEHQYVIFHDMNQRRLFFILLVDFLSKTDSRGPIEQVSFLQGLRKVAERPQFSYQNSESDLKLALDIFIQWLNEKTKIDIWLPSISKDVKLNITRIDYLKMCGDVCKHNYLRSIGVADTLRTVISESGISITQEQAMLTLPDFYEKFSEDILIYLASHFCEMLNNICWGIYRYMIPEFQRSYHRSNGNLAGYSFRVPEDIKSDYARDCYWELMNGIIRKPYFDKFKVSDDFKSEY